MNEWRKEGRKEGRKEWYFISPFIAVSLANFQCSCYTFYDNTTNRDYSVSTRDCRAKEGQLVSLETLEEWTFIKTQLQTRSTNQWWIGLSRENGVWQWVSGQNLTYDKWKPGLKLFTNGQTHAFIKKNEGVLENGYWYNFKGSICEQRKTGK